MQVVGKMATERLRIAMLSRQFSTTGGGAERYAIALVEQLAARHEIHVFAQCIDHQWPGVTYHRVPQLLKRPRWFNQLWYAIATWWSTHQGFDVVHSHENTWHGNVQTMHVLPIKYNLFHDKSGLSFVLYCLRVITSPRLLVYLLLERSRFSMSRQRAIVVTSGSLVAQTALTYPSCRSAISVITPGVEQVYERVSEAMQQATRQHLGLPTTGLCILFVGNDYRKKGLTTLIAAMAGLPADYFLAVVGDAAHIPQFKAQALAAGLDQRIHFLGSRKAMQDVYAAADCLAHPTLEDTFAMVVLEALAHSLPVIVSCEKYCGIAGLLTNEVNALLLHDPTDANALTHTISRVFTESDLREGLINQGLAFARQHSWDKVKNEYDQIYHSGVFLNP